MLSWSIAFKADTQGSSLTRARANDKGWTLCRLQQTIFGIFIDDHVGDRLCTFAFSTSALDLIQSVLQKITQAHPGGILQGTMANEICGLALEMSTKHWRAKSGCKGKAAQQGEHQGRDEKRPQPSQRTISRETKWSSKDVSRSSYLLLQRCWCVWKAAMLQHSFVSWRGPVRRRKLFRFTGIGGIVPKVPRLEFGTTKQL